MADNTAYGQAKKKIEEAWHRQEAVLDLSYSQLTILPPEIGQLTNLSELNLTYNQLTNLPPEIG